MSGTQPLPRFHIDQPDTIPNGVRADLGRFFDRRTRKVGTAGWDGQHRLVVFTPDEIQPHLVVPESVVDPMMLGVALGRLIELDHPDLYTPVGIAIQGDKLEAIKRARVVFDLGLAEAKSLIEAVLVERSERGPITGVTLKDGRTVVVRKQDDDEAKEREEKEREGWSFTSGFPDSGGDDTLELDLREKGIEIRTMRAHGAGGAFKGATVVEGPAGMGIDMHGTVYAPEVAEQIAHQITSAQVTHASVGPVRAEGGHLTGVSLGYTVKRNIDRGHARQARSEEFGDAFDALEQVLSNLGLGEEYQRVLLASMDKHQPEIHAAIMVLRSRLVRDEDRTATSTP